MSVCSNLRCAKPDPGEQGRCLTCNSLLTGRLIRSRYLVQGMVSRGGFGATYLISDHDCFEELRLLKELRPASGSGEDSGPRKETAERLFRREAQTLLNLHHPCIPKLYAFFSQDGFSYLLQEYIPGRTLAQETEDRGESFSEEEARAFLSEISEILNYLHSQEPPIIHRDIKPQNLMRHTDGRLLLIDFGAVCRAANETRADQTLIGSPGYAPPEQIMGQPMPQSDLYAAGATVVRLMTGIHPSQLTNKRTERIEWEVHTGTTPQFANLVNEMLTRDPLRRLQSAQELFRRLEALRSIPPSPRSERSAKQSQPADAVTITMLPDKDATIASETPTYTRGGTPRGIITALTQKPPIEAGALESVPVPALLFRCYQTRVSGVLSCTRGDVSKSIHFDHGAIFFAASSHKEERLAELLLRHGRLSQEEFELATANVDQTGQRMGAALLQLGIISIEEFTPLVVEHVSNLAYSIFDWTEGNYRFEPSPAPAEQIKMPFSTADIIFEGMRRMENMELIKQWLGNFNRRLRTTADPLILYQTVTLNPREAFIVSRIDSVMSIDELLSLGGLPEDETLRTVCGLLAIGMLELLEEAEEEQRKPSLPVGNVLVKPGPLPQDFNFEEAAQFCYEVENKLRRLEHTDAYGILEVALDAADGEISEAYNRAARKFHPDRHSQLLNYNLSLRSDLEKIFKAVHTAYESINAREKTENKLYEAECAVNPKPARSVQYGDPSEAKIQEAKLKESVQWAEIGEHHYRCSQYESARAAFQKAVEIEPNRAEHRLRLARTLSRTAGNFQAAESAFFQALKLEPENADYYAELGLFYQSFSLASRAEEAFTKCLTLAPEHPVGKRSMLKQVS